MSPQTVTSVTGTRSSAVVLLSAGLDSTFNLLKALEKFSVRLVLTFNYGQKAAPREVERSARIAKQFNLRHEVVDLPWFSKFTRTSLLSGDDVPSDDDVEIDSLSRSLETAKSVWVPNRNGIFLNIAAGFAEGLGAEMVVPGFNWEEAQTFPDNSGGFMKALNAAWAFSTNTGVRTHCFSTDLNKSQIVEEGIALKLPFAMLWPCYLAGPNWCGKCESCQRFQRAIEANGLDFNRMREEAGVKAQYLDSEALYDGSQLVSLHNYLQHKLLGDSIVAWVGACDVSFEHMADGEDLLQQAEIKGAKMLHFLVEKFEVQLFSAVALQRLMASIIKDQVQIMAKDKAFAAQMFREGDDLYIDDRKFSISIATQSPVSSLIHFAVNVTNEGTPVKTLALEDLGMDPKILALETMTLFCAEVKTIRQATQKVRWVK